MLADLLTAFTTLPDPVQKVRTGVAAGMINKLLDLGIDAFRSKEPGAIFARVAS